MNNVRQLISSAKVIDQDPDLNLARYKATWDMIPSQYISVMINIAFITVMNTHRVPGALTTIIPALMLIMISWRLVRWYQRRNEAVTAAQACLRLKVLHVAMIVITIVISAWVTTLFILGDDVTKMQAVIFFFATQTFTASHCLSYLKTAAITSVFLMLIPLEVILFREQNITYTIAAISAIATSIFACYRIHNQNRDFTKLVQTGIRLEQTTRDLIEKNLEVRKMADTDYLTGIPNRRAFFNALEAIDYATRHGSAGYVLGVIDLDGFKTINDLHGHIIGDRVIAAFSGRLKALAGNTLNIARLDGDKFGVILPGTLTQAGLETWGDKICSAARTPERGEGVAVHFGASIGFATWTPGETIEKLFEKAELALLVAKTERRGTAVIFAPEHEGERRRRGLIQQELRTVCLEETFNVVFQPIVEIKGHNITAYEALARWTSPTLGTISPEVFIGIAEEIGSINKLTEVLFAKALTAMATWPNHIALSFNLSARNLLSLALIDRLGTMIADSGLAPERIYFEVTESNLIDNFERAGDALRRLKDRGAKIALDDFGTGYSSLSYIHRLPLDRIKIDRSFLRPALGGQPALDVVRTIIYLCHHLKITCVVEGVETANQVERLADIGCTVMQGFYFGYPASNDTLGHVIQAGTVPAPRQELRAVG